MKNIARWHAELTEGRCRLQRDCSRKVEDRQDSQSIARMGRVIFDVYSLFHAVELRFNDGHE
jgi:hypothetical protein